jgi:hypothetical protein
MVKQGWPKHYLSARSALRLIEIGNTQGGVPPVMCQVKALTLTDFAQGDEFHRLFATV